MLLSWLSAALRTVAVTCFFTTSFFFFCSLLITCKGSSQTLSGILCEPLNKSALRALHFIFVSLHVYKNKKTAQTIGTIFFACLIHFILLNFMVFFSSVLPYPVLMLPSHHMNNDFAFLTTKQAATLSCVPCTVGILLFSRLLFAQFLSQCFAPLAFF